MLSWWKTDSHFNHEQNQIIDTKIITATYDSSGSFGSIVRSKSIENNTYTGRRIDLRSKALPIYGPVHKHDLNYLYLRSHSSRLPHKFSKDNLLFVSEIYLLF